MNTKLKDLLATACVIALAFVVFVGVVAFNAPKAQAADSFSVGPSAKLFDTQSASTAQIVTNKAIATTVVALPNTKLLSTGTTLYLHASTASTPFTAGTNVSIVLSSSAVETSVRTNRTPFATNTMTGNQFSTNINVGARTYIYVDSVTPTGVTLTNFQIYGRTL